MNNNELEKVENILVIGDVIENVLLYKQGLTTQAKTELWESRSLGGAFLVAKMLSRALGDRPKVIGYHYDNLNLDQLEQLSPKELKESFEQLNLPQAKWDIGQKNSVLRYVSQPRFDNPLVRHALDRPPHLPELDLARDQFQMLVIEDLETYQKTSQEDRDHPRESNSFQDKKGLDDKYEWQWALEKLSLEKEDFGRADFPQIFVTIDRLLPSLENDEVWKTLLADKKYGTKTLAIVHADILRWEGLNISKNISWERTAQDYLEESHTNQFLQKISEFQHLIVRFGVSGAIHSYRIENRRFHRLFFTPKAPKMGVVRDAATDGFCIGNNSIFVASIIKEIVDFVDSRPEHRYNAYAIVERIGDGIRKSICRCQKYFEQGIGNDLNQVQVSMRRDCGIPNDLFSQECPEEKDIADERIPVGNPSWSILNQSAEYKLLDIAQNIVLKGIDKTLNYPDPEGKKPTIWSPVVEFGDDDDDDPLIVVDRRELESYRIIYRLMKAAIQSKTSRPLSIAVFGPPGSGKSFVVKKIAASAGINVKENFVLCNLAELLNPSDLRERVDKRVKELEGKKQIPFVFFDEFDCDLNSNKLGWLKYFLPYMEDWKSQLKGGNPIFVFAGGTSYTYRDFTREDPSLDKQEQANFAMAKGPDFISRLRGHINILGPNPVSVDEFDQAYVIRRALLLRSILQKSVTNPDKLENYVNPEIVRAMLEVSSYKHGARSMRAIIQMCDKLGGRDGKYVSAVLPTLPQLNMHVDGKELIDRLIEFRDRI